MAAAKTTPRPGPQKLRPAAAQVKYRVPQDEQEALEAVNNGEAVAVPSLLALLRGIASTVSQVKGVREELSTLSPELVRILTGQSDVQPARGDRRFADPAWQSNPLFRRLQQTYLATSGSLQRLVDQLDGQDSSWQEVERARFAVNLLVSAAAPTNVWFTNPAAMKTAFDTAGGSVVKGAQQWWSDLRENGGMPSQTDRHAFTVGVDLAATPGAVIDRDEYAELIQYTPTTDSVRRRPLLIIPPPIGRYYFLDLRPSRSFVEHAVAAGQQVFMLSWRNPGPAHASWNLNDYSTRILSAIEVTRNVTRSRDVNVLGFCAGGLLTTVVLNHLAEQGDDRVHSASFGVMLLDYAVEAPLGAFSAPRALELAGSDSGKKGIIAGDTLGKVFAWMRPDDLVFNYWVNNYLLGQSPPVFDILAWNADSTNLPAGLHRQFLQIFAENLLCRPGALNVLGTPVDLSRITIPTYVTGAVTDHLTPWKGCYRTTQLFGGPSTFVLSNAGHIASLVNPPGNPKSSFFENGPAVADPDQWLTGAAQRSGTWWTHWAKWINEQSGPLKNAPKKLGNAAHPPLDPAPGTYVRAGTPKGR